MSFLVKIYLFFTFVFSDILVRKTILISDYRSFLIIYYNNKNIEKIFLIKVVIRNYIIYIFFIYLILN